MGRPHRSKVALVKRRNLWLTQALGERHDAGVDDPEGEIRVESLQLAATGKIGARRRLDPIDPGEEIVEEDEPGRGWQSAVAPIVELRKHESWNDQILLRVKSPAGRIARDRDRRHRGRQGVGPCRR